MDVNPNLLSIGGLFPSLQLALDLADAFARELVRGYRLFIWYGESGIPLFLFGNRTTWRLQAQILGQLKDEDALAFKSSVYNECTMIAVSSAIVAQIAITGLSLNFLSQTHWFARSCFVLSLTFALMAVYYATTQQRTLGRLLKAKDVRLWIRGGNRGSQTGRIVPPLHAVIRNLHFDILPQWLHPNTLQARLLLVASYSSVLSVILRGFMIPFSNFSSSDPDDYSPDLPRTNDIKSDVIYRCFTPSAASVITISAPQMMLTSSLVMLLIALAIYFGFVWTRNLDLNAGHNDSKNVFITYVVGLGVAWLVYTVSQLYQDDDKRSERQIVEGYLEEYLADHPQAATRWGLDTQHATPLADIRTEDAEQDVEGQTLRGS